MNFREYLLESLINEVRGDYTDKDFDKLVKRLRQRDFSKDSETLNKHLKDLNALKGGTLGKLAFNALTKLGQYADKASIEKGEPAQHTTKVLTKIFSDDAKSGMSAEERKSGLNYDMKSALLVKKIFGIIKKSSDGVKFDEICGQLPKFSRDTISHILKDMRQNNIIAYNIGDKKWAPGPKFSSRDKYYSARDERGLNH